MKVVLLLILLLATSVWAAPPSPEDQTIEAIASFLENQGDRDNAQAVRAQYRAVPPVLRFGQVQDNDNAQTDVTGDHRTVLNVSAVGQILGARGLDRYRLTAEWARCVRHEMKHQQQDTNAWRGAYWMNLAGQGHACEREAWEQGFQANYDWMRRALAELGDSRKNSEERANAARRLEVMAAIFIGYPKDYKSGYGPIFVTQPGGVRIGLAEALAEAAVLQDKARQAVALEEDREGKALNLPPEGWVATYHGSFIGDATGTIKFTLRGHALSGEYSGRETKRGASINGGAPEAMVRYDPKTGDFTALFMGSQSSLDPDGMGML